MFISFGVLIRPIHANPKHKRQENIKTSRLKPEYGIEGIIYQMHKGINQRWWKVVANLNFDVSGQIIYLATPIMNFLFTRKLEISMYLN